MRKVKEIEHLLSSQQGEVNEMKRIKRKLGKIPWSDFLGPDWSFRNLESYKGNWKASSELSWVEWSSLLKVDPASGVEQDFHKTLPDELMTRKVSSNEGKMATARRMKELEKCALWYSELNHWSVTKLEKLTISKFLSVSLFKAHLSAKRLLWVINFTFNIKILISRE